MQLKINDKGYEIPQLWQEAPLLTVLRDLLGLTGTKFGCGKGICGACTIHLDGQATRSCVLPVSAALGKSITTIEGLATAGQLHPVQQAWKEESVPQCGYCQSGQIMTAAALLSTTPAPSNAQVIEAMSDNLCRCGTYGRIRAGVMRAAEITRERS
jgi:isoquinoline 1-oxidoreductase alpha subunit